METPTSLSPADFFLPGRITHVFGDDRVLIARQVVAHARVSGTKVTVIRGRDSVLTEELADAQDVERILPLTQQDMVGVTLRQSVLGSGLLVIDGVIGDIPSLWMEALPALRAYLDKSRVAILCLSRYDELGMLWRFSSYRRMEVRRGTFTFAKEYRTAAMGCSYKLQEDGTWSLVRKEGAVIEDLDGPPSLDMLAGG